MTRLDRFLACLVAFFLSMSALFWRAPSPQLTKEEVQALMLTLPSLAKEDFSRLATAEDPSRRSVWEAVDLRAEPAFEDWYGWRGEHSIKTKVTGWDHDGHRIVAFYKVSLSDASCTERPTSCASLVGLSSSDLGGH